MSDCAQWDAADELPEEKEWLVEQIVYARIRRSAVVLAKDEDEALAKYEADAHEEYDEEYLSTEDAEPPTVEEYS